MDKTRKYAIPDDVVRAAAWKHVRENMEEANGRTVLNLENFILGNETFNTIRASGREPIPEGAFGSGDCL